MTTVDEGEVLIGCVAAMLIMAAADLEGSLSKRHKVLDVASTLLKDFAKPSELLSALEELSCELVESSTQRQQAFFLRYSEYPAANKFLILDAAGMIGVIGGEFSDIDQNCLFRLANWINISAEEFSAWRVRFNSMRPESTGFDLSDLFQTLGFKPSF